MLAGEWGTYIDISISFTTFWQVGGRILHGVRGLKYDLICVTSLISKLPIIIRRKQMLTVKNNNKIKFIVYHSFN